MMSWVHDGLVFFFGACAGVVIVCIFITWFFTKLKNSLEGALKMPAGMDAEEPPAEADEPPALEPDPLSTVPTLEKEVDGTE